MAHLRAKHHHSLGLNIYIVTLRVEIDGTQIRKRTCFGERSVDLTPEMRIKYRADGAKVPHIHGVGSLIILLIRLLPKKYTTNYSVVVENAGRNVKITGAVNDIPFISTFLQRFEIEQLLPRQRALVEAGGLVDSGALKYSLTEIYVGRRKIARPLIERPTFKGGYMYFRYGRHWWSKTRIRLRDVWNPNAMFELLKE